MTSLPTNKYPRLLGRIQKRIPRILNRGVATENGYAGQPGQQVVRPAFHRPMVEQAFGSLSRARYDAALPDLAKLELDRRRPELVVLEALVFGWGHARQYSAGGAGVGGGV